MLGRGPSGGTLRVVLVVLVALGGAVASAAARGAAQPPGATGDPVLARVRSHLMLVGHGQPTESGWSVRWLGTGFLVDERCRALTAAHILEGAGPSYVIRLADPTDPDQGVTLQARLAWRDAERDLALLDATVGPGRGVCPLGALEGLVLSASQPARALTGAEIFVAGFPALEGGQPREVPIVRRGSVASAELTWEGRPMLLLDLTGIPGFSGAPVVLRETGEVIGLVYGPGRTARQYDLEWATPVSREDHERALRSGR